MKLENQVVSLELAKQLKELGVKQDSLFEYRQFSNGDELFWSKPILVGEIPNKMGLADVGFGSCSAFTVAELYNLLYMHGIGDILLDGVKPEHLADYLGEKLCKAL